MGHVKRDLGKQAIKNDTTYPYTDAGIERLLKDIYKFDHECTYGGNYDTVILRVDLERALQSHALSPRQRVAIGLYYFAQLTQEECARVLGVTQQALDDRLSTATSNLAEYMAGFNVASSQTVFAVEEMLHNQQLNKWINAMLWNDVEWWKIPDGVFHQINEHVGVQVEFVESIDDDGDEYPYLTTRQMRTRNREMEILRDEIYPVRPNTGTRRSLDDGKKIRLV